MATVYDDMNAAGLVTGSHYSDLYVRNTPEARAILARHGLRIDGWNVQRFRDNVSGEASLDLPLRFDPYWKAREAAR